MCNNGLEVDIAEGSAEIYDKEGSRQRSSYER